MDLKEEDILGAGIGSHWYYRSKAAALRSAVRTLAPRRLLDVGAGSGFFSKHLLSHGDAKSALCVDTGYARDHDETVAGKPVQYRRDCGQTDCDLVLMMDVLEHVDDDRALIRHYADRVPTGAHFLVTVPAFRFLWSDAGLSVTFGAYYFGAIFPLVAAVRLAARGDTQPKSSLKKHSALVNGLLAAACRIELPFFPINRIAGLSAFVLARKS